MKALVLPKNVLYMHKCTIFYTYTIIKLYRRFLSLRVHSRTSPRGLSGASSLLQLLIGSGGGGRGGGCSVPAGGDGPPPFSYTPHPVMIDRYSDQPCPPLSSTHPPTLYRGAGGGWWRRGGAVLRNENGQN
jgi:hypothetical protein